MSTRIIEAVRSVAFTDTLLVALDFDGTVSELQDEPMAVRAIPAAAQAVDTLSRLDDTYVAYVSGRSLRDLLVISERPPVSPILLAASHGAEFLLSAAVEPAEEAVRAEPEDASALRAAAEAAVAAIDGARIEPKTFGFALHTRLAGPEQTRAAVRTVDAIMHGSTRGQTPWRRRDGHDVVEFAWRAEGKDDAVAALRAATGATAVLFAGDDVTDEDALRSLGDDDLGIRVGAGETAARLTVADPQELAAVLGIIAAVRGGRAA